MYQWFACHLRGFRNAQGISWPNSENCTATPTPLFFSSPKFQNRTSWRYDKNLIVDSSIKKKERTVGILEAELLKADVYL